ncbi:hypothetical protein HRbin07_00100 [bacterium HR07]|nr:hypothetical protein HRbin07_00100 [bacterium HR07]
MHSLNLQIVEDPIELGEVGVHQFHAIYELVKTSAGELQSIGVAVQSDEQPRLQVRRDLGRMAAAAHRAVYVNAVGPHG